MFNFIRYNKIFSLYEKIQPYLKYSLPVEAKLPGKKALVFAPHQDDEVIGCGGTLYRHIKAGGEATVIYATHDTDQRKKEAMAALPVLGVKNALFGEYKVESLKGQKSMAGKMEKSFDTLKPDIVFLPFFMDNHADHRAMNQALFSLEAKKYDFLVYAYPVWFPVYPNVVVDISKEWEIKKKALLCYKSQLATRDYVTMSYALGQYWAKVKGRNMEVVETFFKASFKEYIKLGKSVYGK